MMYDHPSCSTFDGVINQITQLKLHPKSARHEYNVGSAFYDRVLLFQSATIMGKPLSGSTAILSVRSQPRV